MNTLLRLIPCLALCVSACGAQPGPGPALGPKARALKEAQASVTESKAEAREASEDADSFALLVRHNPARCDAPEFEVYMRGRWTRAYLDVEVPRVNALLEGLRASSLKGTTLKVNALPTTSTKLSGLRVAWPIVEIVGLAQSDAEEASSAAPAAALVQSSPC